MNTRWLNRRLENQAGADGGGGGTSQQQQAPWFGEFKADAPQDFKDWVGNKAFPDAQSALYSAFNQEKLIGAEKAGRTVLWPKDEKDADGWKAIHSKLGVPAKPEEYGITAGKDDDAGLVNAFAGFLHANNVPKGTGAALFQALQKHVTEAQTAANTAIETKSRQELDALNAEWGSAAKTNTEVARRFAAELGITTEQSEALEKVMGTANYLKLMHKGGAKLGELTVPGGEGGGGGATQAQAKEQLEAARVKRAAGEISLEAWEEIQKRLAPVAYPQAA
jgi:hypothetical protein